MNAQANTANDIIGISATDTSYFDRQQDIKSIVTDELSITILCQEEIH